MFIKAENSVDFIKLISIMYMFTESAEQNILSKMAVPALRMI